MNTVPKLDDDDWDLEAQDKQRIEKEKKKNLLMQLFRETGIAKVPAILKFLGAFLDDRLSGKVHSAKEYLGLLMRSYLRFDRFWFLGTIEMFWMRWLSF